MTDLSLVQRLQARMIRRLPQGWQKGRECPECHADADRPKCLWELGAMCPRHDPRNYDPSPYKEIPDPLCQEAANHILELEASLEHS